MAVIPCTATDPTLFGTEGTFGFLWQDYFAGSAEQQRLIFCNARANQPEPFYFVHPSCAESPLLFWPDSVVYDSGTGICSIDTWHWAGSIASSVVAPPFPGTSSPPDTSHDWTCCLPNGIDPTKCLRWARLGDGVADLIQDWVDNYNAVMGGCPGNGGVSVRVANIGSPCTSRVCAWLDGGGDCFLYDSYPDFAQDFGYTAGATVTWCGDPVQTLQYSPDVGAYRCFGCSSGVGLTYNPYTRRCETEPCPPGTFCCEPLSQCIPAVVIPCAVEKGCVWQAEDICNWVCPSEYSLCDHVNRYHWDNLLCQCVQCPEPYYWCDKIKQCQRVVLPQCLEELNCVWNDVDCRFDCDTPHCPPGQVYHNTPRTGTCECIPDCSAGTCWCEGDPYDPNDGGCIPCVRPDCWEELNCAWNTLDCVWECDSIEDICGPANIWDYVECRCGNGGNSFHLRDTNDQFHIFHRELATGTMVDDRWGADDTEEETVEIDPADDCRCPSFWLLDGVLGGIYLRGTTPILAQSRNHGKSWELTEIPGEYATLSSIEHRGRLLVMGFRAGVWYQRVGKVELTGEVIWSEEVDSAIEETLDPAKSPTGNGHFRDPVDNMLTFAWEDTDGDWHIGFCRGIDLQAIGDWNAAAA